MRGSFGKQLVYLPIGVLLLPKAERKLNRGDTSGTLVAKRESRADGLSWHNRREGGKLIKLLVSDF
jgi:hypothetical protein